MTEERISRDAAEGEFERFATFADLDMGSHRAEHHQVKMETYREHFIENVMSGRITVDTDGAVTCITKSETLPKVSFSRQPIQNDKRAQDLCKPLELEKKEDMWLSRVTGAAPAQLGKLTHKDITMVKEVFRLFLDEPDY